VIDKQQLIVAVALAIMSVGGAGLMLNSKPPPKTTIPTQKATSAHMAVNRHAKLTHFGG
jgi:hypothetical protein